MSEREDRVLGCARCGAMYLAEGTQPGQCPRCRAPLQQAPAREIPPLERALVRRVSEQEASRAVAAFAGEIWFAAPDLAEAAKAERFAVLWWPRWLVDVDAVGIWEAQVGFDYRVESSQESYEGGRWKTKTVEETRVRYEPRLGRLSHRYDNLMVPALAHDPKQGDADPSRAELRSERPDGYIELPSRSKDEAWPDVIAALRERIGEDCGKACGAQHVSDVFLDIDAGGAHWTLLLLPTYATWYRDEEGTVRVLSVDGVSGAVSGLRLASVAAGRRAAMMWFFAGGVLGALGLVVGAVGLLLWVLLPVAGVLLFAGAIVGLVGFWPLLAPGQHNRTELQRS